ncbi:hypothetical protein RND71_035345 [Anisodus tanguticus]|uniref:Uncharacterized protein n=1 Tax=Anisodus tanguticus TaxID=243964 RepID=A0AAE1R5M6_9SOLA|nr:hypothetical protein RND71_035345 [Anisodus tanguticus]
MCLRTSILLAFVIFLVLKMVLRVADMVISLIRTVADMVINCFCSVRPKWKKKKKKRLALMTANHGRGRIVRLFAQTQKLEQQIGRNPYLPQVSELGLNLDKLESDLQDALAALKKKE